MKGKKEMVAREELKTPCYIVHDQILKDDIVLLKESLNKQWKHYYVGYSFKTNSLPFVVETMKENDIYAEVVSEDEYLLALKYGYKKIIYNGPVKGKETFLHALNHGAIINLDAKRELDWLAEYGAGNAKIGLRVNFDLESMVPLETSAGTEGSRFGFPLETGEFEAALERLKEMNIPLFGIHLHVSSKTRSLNIYRALAIKACEIKEKFDLKLNYVDFGGGYFGGLNNKPQYPDYLKVIVDEMKKVFSVEETAIIMEPGTSMISAPIEYLTTVIDTKESYANHHVITDGSRIDIDPRFMKSSYFYHIHRKEGAEGKKLEKQVISGFTCMEDDRLFILENEKELKPGDQISYDKVGGYTICLTPLFIRYFPRVYLEKDGNYQLLRTAWGVEEYAQNNVALKDLK